MTSRSAGVAAAGGAALGALIGALTGDPGAIVLGTGAFAGVGWLARVALATVGAGPRRERIDPFALSEPWRHFVRGALQAQARFDRTVSQARPGPLRDRLHDVGRRIDAGVRECWLVAQEADELEDAIATLDAAGARRRLEELGQGDQDDPTVARMKEALDTRLATAARMQAVVEQARDKLRLLDARLGEAVARGVELSVRTDAGAEAVGLGADVEDLLLELTALRQALEETGGGTAPPDAGAGGTGG